MKKMVIEKAGEGSVFCSILSVPYCQIEIAWLLQISTILKSIFQKSLVFLSWYAGNLNTNSLWCKMIMMLNGSSCFPAILSRVQLHTLSQWKGKLSCHCDCTHPNTYANEPQRHVQDFSLSLSGLKELRQALNFLSLASHLEILTDPHCRHADSFPILSRNSASQPLLFLPSSWSWQCSTCLSQHLTHWKFQSIAWEPEILWKTWFAFRKHFFSCYAIFTWIWTYKIHDLTDYHFNVGSFLPAITFM